MSFRRSEESLSGRSPLPTPGSSRALAATARNDSPTACQRDLHMPFAVTVGVIPATASDSEGSPVSTVEPVSRQVRLGALFQQRRRIRRRALRAFRRTQKNCNCYHRGGRGGLLHQPSRTEGVNGNGRNQRIGRMRPDAGRVGSATSRDGRGNGLVRPMRREGVPLVQRARSTVCRGRNGMALSVVSAQSVHTPGSGYRVEAVRPMVAEAAALPS